MNILLEGSKLERSIILERFKKLNVRVSTLFKALAANDIHAASQVGGWRVEMPKDVSYASPNFSHSYTALLKVLLGILLVLCV